MDPPPRVPRGERASAIGIARLFLALGVGAIIYFLVDRITRPLFDRASAQGSGQVATDGTTYLQQAVDFIPIAVLLISFFGLIAYSVYTRVILQ